MVPCVANAYYNNYGSYHVHQGSGDAGFWFFVIIGAIVLWVIGTVAKSKREDAEYKRVQNLPENVAKREAAAKAKRLADEQARVTKVREDAIKLAWYNEERGKIIRGQAIPFCIRHLHVVPYHDKAGSGVYFLFDGEILAYVGKAGTSVNDRVESHRRSDGKVFDRAWFVSVHPNHVDEMERSLIRSLKPRDNKVRYHYG